MTKQQIEPFYVYAAALGVIAVSALMGIATTDYNETLLGFTAGASGANAVICFVYARKLRRLERQNEKRMEAAKGRYERTE